MEEPMNFFSIRNPLQEVIVQIESRLKLGRKFKISTGLFLLDRITKGLEKPAVVIFFTPENYFSNVLAANFYSNFEQDLKKKVKKSAYVDFTEDGIGVFTEILLRLWSGIKRIKFLTGILSPKDFSKLLNAAGKMTQIGLQFKKSSHSDILDEIKQLKAFFKKNSIDVVFLNGIQSEDYSQDLLKTLKETAEECNCVFICLSVKTEKDDLNFSEQQKRYFNEYTNYCVKMKYPDNFEPIKPEKCSLEMIANRYGPTGKIKIKYDPDLSVISDSFSEARRKRGAKVLGKKAVQAVQEKFNGKIIE